MIDRAFDLIVYYLPVFVPFALAVFSVITRIVSGTMELKLRNFLRTYTDIVLGIFSFLIWALITYMQTGQVALNSDLSIPFPKLIILLILDMILLVAAAIMSRHQWTDSLRFPTLTSVSKERFMDTGMIFITIFMFILPVFISSKPKVVTPPVSTARYRIALPYEDPTIPGQIGAGRWAGRRLCEIFEVEARDEEQALELAKARFSESGRAHALFPRGTGTQEVVRLERPVVIQAQK